MLALPVWPEMLELLQMGGPAGVLASEHVLMTVSPSKGMKMQAVPRAGPSP